MAGEDAAREAPRDHGLGNDAERAGGGIGGFIDMEIEIPAFPFGQREEGVEALAQPRDHVGHGAENIRAVGVEHPLDGAHVRFVEREIDVEQRRRLQFDPAAPALAGLGDDRPADLRLRPDAVDMGPDGCGAVRVSRAKAELHPLADVSRGPVGGAIPGDRRERA